MRVVSNNALSTKTAEGNVAFHDRCHLISRLNLPRTIESMTGKHTPTVILTKYKDLFTRCSHNVFKLIKLILLIQHTEEPEKGHYLQMLQDEKEKENSYVYNTISTCFEELEPSLIPYFCSYLVELQTIQCIDFSFIYSFFDFIFRFCLIIAISALLSQKKLFSEMSKTN